MEYAYFKLEPKGNWANLYPIVCWHLGVPESDDDFIREHIQRIADDPNGWWFYMGDMGDCITKHSKGYSFEQFLSPEEQIEYAVELLEPIKDKGLFGVAGNHGDRIFRETGKSFDTDLCMRLGVPYKGVATFFHLDVHGTRYDIYCRHGLTSGRTMASKVNSAMRAGEDTIADAVITGHSHVAMELEPRSIRRLKVTAKKKQGSSGAVFTQFVHQYICGSAYDSRSGYAEEKGYSPILPVQVQIGFHGSKTSKKGGGLGAMRGSRPRADKHNKGITLDPHQQRFEIFRADPSVEPASIRWRRRLKKAISR